MRYLIFVVICFAVFCGWLVIESGLFECGLTEPVEVSLQGGQPCILLQKTIGEEKSGAENAPAKESPKIGAAESISFTADFAPAQSIILGAKNPETEDPDVGFKFQLELSSKGAAIRKATFSNGNNNGFDDRDPKNPRPLVIISPMQRSDGSEVLAMANTGFVLTEYELELLLDSFHWKSFDVETSPDGSQTARFETTIRFEATNEPVMKLTKTYKVRPGSYLMDCDITVENLSGQERGVRFNLAGPGGLGREGFRSDMRKVVGGFRVRDTTSDQFISPRLNLTGFSGRKVFDEEVLDPENADFLWAGTTNKYFAAIAVPIPDKGEKFCDWITGKRNQQGERQPVKKKKKGIRYSILRAITGKPYEVEVLKTGKSAQYYNPDGKKNSGDEAIGVGFDIDFTKLQPSGHSGSTRDYSFQIYLRCREQIPKCNYY